MEEMCANYIHYYPRTQLELCKSHVDADYLQKYFSLINRYGTRFTLIQAVSHVACFSPLLYLYDDESGFSRSFHPH
jgi:hypothetical protein